jgi:hypothetical protein
MLYGDTSWEFYGMNGGVDEGLFDALWERSQNT